MTQPSNPDYHWNPAQMRAFLEALAETGVISAACEAVGKSRRAAYNLRFRAEGRAFAMGWDAALLVARACLADTLMERALVGFAVVSQRDAETGTTTTQRIDNRCAMGMLGRLDRMTGLGMAPEPGSDAALARIVAQDFWHFLDLVEQGGAGSEAALFVAARSPATAPECELAEDWDDDWDDDGAEEAAEEEEQDTSPLAQAARMHVWWDDFTETHLTNFPPPDGFAGYQSCDFGGPDYYRELSRDEILAQMEIGILLAEPLRQAGERARERWFSFPDRLRPVISQALEKVAADIAAAEKEEQEEMAAA